MIILEPVTIRFNDVAVRAALVKLLGGSNGRQLIVEKFDDEIYWTEASAHIEVPPPPPPIAPQIEFRYG